MKIILIRKIVREVSYKNYGNSCCRTKKIVSIFSTDPLPFVLVKAKKQKLAVEETNKLRDTISIFASYCQLIIFCNIVHRQYVGASDYDQS